ncbi:TonB-dependent receptor [Lysobacteraceae bacterium NML08-0793]|nr:TonB-dependent receptor [Xanthomonadaceae bacterium NML08-0793]
MTLRNRHLKPNALSTALIAVLAFASSHALAQEAQQEQPTANSQQPNSNEKKNSLDRVVVTGSLIPASQVETVTPVTTIKAEQIDALGFSGVTEALQQSSGSTGGVQGDSTNSATFTKGAETMSMFGLAPGYTKYLIDGRPMANYPALYNGSDVFNNISGIPIDLVDRVEILPGGQSSLYGSDAIAGVVNFILKKNLDGTVVNLRGGWFHEGGGQSQRLSLADSFSFADGRLNVLFGLQHEKRKPVWASQRELTRQYNTNAYNGAPPVASRDWLIYGYRDIANNGFDDYGYVFADPNNCANVSSAFAGTEGKQYRDGSGDYCGSFYSPGYRTLRSEKESSQLYSHATFDLNENHTLYADLLISDERVRSFNGAGYVWWGTGSALGSGFYEPNLDALVNLQRAFSPEDMDGDWQRTRSKNKSRSYTVTFGARGTLGESGWDYDFSLTRNQYKLDNFSGSLLAKADDYFFDTLLGPQQGNDPYLNRFPVYTLDYAKFYSMLPSGVFTSMYTDTHSRSRTFDNMARLQLTQASLFGLPGGDAGLAVALETANEGWEYIPDSKTQDGSLWGLTDVAGSGRRSRYAITSELRLPVWDKLTIAASARYDNFKVAEQHVDKPTYSIGLEFRPFESLLIRGKYGTAFKVPTLSDQFQGLSGFYSSTTDYYRCYNLGFDPGNIENCPTRYRSVQYFGQQRGNPELQPINADVWSIGMVWAPSARFSLAADYYNWEIRDEVSRQSTAALMLDEMSCRTGGLDPNSGTCVAALSQVVRDANDNIELIRLNKINVAKESLRVLQAKANYSQPLERFGMLNFGLEFTKVMSHGFQRYPTDNPLDILNDPYYSTDPKRKANATLGWRNGAWDATLYANYISSTPNYRSTITALRYDNPGAAKLGSYTYYNASVGFKPTEDIRLSFMVNNLFNRMPTMDTTYPGTSNAPFNSYNYGVLGRGYYLQMRWEFGKNQ